MTKPADARKVAPPASPAQAASLGWRFLPHTLIFFSSACVMAVELVAGRLTGRHMGTSLYTWTSIIGVVLAGMSVGNWIGGMMADRWAPRRLLGWLFLAASLTCIACLLLNKLVADMAAEDSAAKVEMSYPVRVFLSMLVIFLLPALALGTISPVTAKMALMRGGGMGATIGSVYAWGAVGSIVGTFLTGFWLIAALGSTGVMIAIAMALALMGLALGPGRLVHAIWLVVLLGLLWLSQTRSLRGFQQACSLGLQDGQPVTRLGQTTYAPLIFARDSAYQFVKVIERDGDGGRHLVLDSGWHSFINLKDPLHLEYAYEKVYGALTDICYLHWNKSLKLEKADTFFIGGGGYTFPRWVKHRWPASACDVAEIDPVVLEACHVALGLPRDTPIRTVLKDARLAVNELPRDRRYDLIIGDAFNNELTLPWHLTTVEFHRRLKRHMMPHSVMLTNIIDSWDQGGRLLGSYAATMRKVFKHVHVFSVHVDGVEEGRDNFVVLSTDWDEPSLHAALLSLQPGHEQTFPGSILTDKDLAELDRKCRGRILTDDDAPVENMVAPIAR